MPDRVERPWVIRRADPPAAARLAAGVGVPPVVGQLLLNRGLTTPGAARRWLDTPAADIPPPDALPGAVEAGTALAEAAAGGARVCVYGDYDVDGTTGAATLARTLTALGAAVTVYVPHRLEEGYGVNPEAVRRIARAGHTHLVTVDCGVTAVAETALARSLGLAVTLTDHHQPKDELPDAVLVHPSLPGRVGGAPNLCGSAVAWMVARAALESAARAGRPRHAAGENPEALRDDSLARAAVGTVADVVPLLAETRAVVRHGLAALAATADPGLSELVRSCGLDGRVTAEDVGFRLGPRINAAGRLGAAGRVIDLLAGRPDRTRAAELAAYLDYANRLRQGVERAIAGGARGQAAAQVAAGRPAVVVAAADWHPGVIGIVASRLVEWFGRPALVVSFGTRSGVGYGSGRSIPGLPLHDALRACGRWLKSHGGHAMAAGFKVTRGDLDGLKAAFWDYCGGRYGGPPPPPPLVAEARAAVRDLTPALVAALDRLEPHGAANPRPYFALTGCRVESAKTVGGRGDHLSLTLSHPGGGSADRIRCVGFGMGERLAAARGFVDAVGVPRINEWQGRRSVELELKDFRPSVPGR